MSLLFVCPQSAIDRYKGIGSLIIPSFDVYDRKNYNKSSDTLCGECTL